MKKILIALCCYGFFLVSCGDDKKAGEQVAVNSASSVTKDSSIADSTARRMIDSLKYKKTKLKINGIVWSRFDSAAMRRIYSDTSVIDVVFFLAVWPDSKHKDVPVILVQVKRKKTGSEVVDPKYEYFVSTSLCPPPNDITCGTVENPNNQN